MSTPNRIRPIDQFRTARIALAMIDGDLERVETVIDEVQDDGTAHLVVVTLLQWLINAMQTDALPDMDSVRKTFERTILDTHNVMENGNA